MAPADLAGVRLLHVLGYNDGWATWLAAAGAGSVDAAAGLQVDNSVLAFAIAAGGGGVALGRTSMIAQGLNAGLLVRPFPLCVPVQEAFYLVSPDQEQAGYVAHPDAQVFRGWLMSQARQDRL